MNKPLTERYAAEIVGVLSCFDRIVIMGTLPEICHAGAMESLLRSRGVRLFDYTQVVEPWRDEIRAHAERVAQEAGLEVEFIRRKNFRKEDRVQAILVQRGREPGLVHIFSAMEPCSCFKPWHDKKTGKTSLRTTEGKCLHYYFYFVDEDLGLCYLRVPTWAPFRLQFYCNGHNLLAARLRRAGIEFSLLDNAFVAIANFAEAQRLADDLRVDALHRRLDLLARQYVPVVKHFRDGYHWSLMQIEYATDLVFRRSEQLRPLYEVLARTAVHTVKPENVATFLGRRLDERYQGELGNDFHTRIEGTRIKHHMGGLALKMYDKLGRILRLETTANDVTLFRHHRRVEHRDGTWEMKVAPVKKSIYSLPALAELMAAANRRYLDYLSCLDDPSAGLKDLDKLGERVHDRGRTYPGFNLFASTDLALFEAIVRGEFLLSGFQNRHLQALLPRRTTAAISRLLKRLRTHGMVKKVGRTYKYYLTALGRRVVLAALKLRRHFLAPALAGATPA
jgi:hypothetical protein